MGLGPVACVAEGNFPKRFADAFCDKLDECGPNPFPDCKDMFEKSIEADLDECDDYKGGLAHQCIQDIKKLSCDDNDYTADGCEEFNEACGISEEVEVAPGYFVRGLSVRRVPGDATASP